MYQIYHAWVFTKRTDNRGKIVPHISECSEQWETKRIYWSEFEQPKHIVEIVSSKAFDCVYQSQHLTSAEDQNNWYSTPYPIMTCDHPQ